MSDASAAGDDNVAEPVIKNAYAKRENKFVCDKENLNRRNNNVQRIIRQLSDYVKTEQFACAEYHKCSKAVAEDKLCGKGNKLVADNAVYAELNTLYGHQEGDRVIRFVASILKENIDGIVGRNGGDEFLFCLAAVDSKTTIENEIRTVFEKLQEGLINLETGERMSIPCSIGIFAESGSQLHYSYMVQGADAAMYQAKELGKNTYYLNYN